MTKQATDLQSFISSELHSLLFFEEFTFSRNKFSPPSTSELEFADAVVMLGDVLLIYQIKERSAAKAGDAEAELAGSTRRCSAMPPSRCAAR